MEKYVNLCLYVDYFKSYAVFWILFVRGLVRDYCKYGQKWGVGDIISACYLADSENRQFKDLKKSGGIKSIRGVQVNPSFPLDYICGRKISYAKKI